MPATTPLTDLPDDARIAEAVRLCEERRVSLGKAVELAGCSYAELAWLLGSRGVTTWTMTADELAEDVRNA